MQTTKPINTLIENFLDEQAVKEYSKITYRQALKTWVRFCINQKIDVRHPRKADAVFFISWMKSKNFKVNTINLNLAVLRKFFFWLEANGIYANIVNGIKRIRNSKKHLKKYLTEEQIVKLLNSISKENSFTGKRDYCLIFLMVSTGLRRSEVARLKFSNIIWHNNTGKQPMLKIYRKGQDFCTYLGLSPQIKNELIDFWNYRDAKENISRETHIFTSKNNKRKLNPGSISRIIKNRLRAIGIDDPMITAHSLRHSAAIIALKHGVDLFAVSKMLGHSSLETTKIYLQAISEEIELNNPAVHELSKTFYMGRPMTPEELYFN